MSKTKLEGETRKLEKRLKTIIENKNVSLRLEGQRTQLKELMLMTPSQKIQILIQIISHRQDQFQLYISKYIQPVHPQWRLTGTLISRVSFRILIPFSQ